MNESKNNPPLKPAQKPKEFTRDRDSEFGNTERDEATVGTHKDKNVDPKFADKDQPEWQPPESQPEPRPANPIMNSTQQTNLNTSNSNSPA